MSAMLESLLHACGDTERLADMARNDALAGIAAPPVVMDEEFFRGVDLAMLADKKVDGYEQRRIARGLKLERGS